MLLSVFITAHIQLYISTLSIIVITNQPECFNILKMSANLEELQE